MNYIRSRDWWGQNLSLWDLDFHGDDVPEMPGCNKGIHGVKKKLN